MNRKPTKPIPTMRIALIGAYGFTGTLISRELQKAQIPFSVYGRNMEKLEMLADTYSMVEEPYKIDLRQLADIEMVLSQSDLVINCAGPFTEESALLMQQIAQSGKIYLDITGEVGFVRTSREKYHQTALDHQSLIIHGCAFESLIADLATELLVAQFPNPSSIRTFYQFDQLRVSPGTKMTMKLSKFRDSLMIRNKQWAVSDFTDDQLQVNTDLNEELVAIPYPLPEIAYNHWNHKVETAGSFLLIGEKEARLLAGKPEVEGDALHTLDEIRLRKRKGPNEEQRAVQKSKLVIEVVDAEMQSHHLLLVSMDMYLTTAKVIVKAVQEINKFETIPSGVLSPAVLFAQKEAETLASLDIAVKQDSGFKIA